MDHGAGSTAYITILFIIHIGGAIVGIGPTYGFGVIGSMIKKNPQYALALTEAMVAIEKRVVTPVALVTQPLSGILLIWKLGFNHDFFSHTWLWVAILVYAALLVLSYIVNAPVVHKLVELMKSDRPDMEQIGALAKKASAIGPVLGIMGVIIIVLMIWKPGN